MSDKKNILIIKPSAIGDIVLALPALHALRLANPDSKIAWLVRSEYADLLRGHPDLDEIILFDRLAMGKWWKPQAVGAFFKLIRQLREENFDAAFDFQGLFRSAFFSFVSGAKTRFGIADAREGATLFYNNKIKQDAGCIHLTDYYLKMVESFTNKPAKAEFFIPSDQDKMISDKNDYAVLVPGSARAEKCWPTERFAEIAALLVKNHNLKIVTVGTKSEQKLTAAIQTSCDFEVTDLAGKTSLTELTAILRKAKVVVSNDTGPGHIAAALGVPTVLIFGPTNPARVCPYGKLETVAAFDAEARGFKADSYDPAHSIERISVNDVWEKIQKTIGADIKAF